jgi:two-component system, chemotaxis family, protein-glutamate methylesterase/glutaminase
MQPHTGHGDAVEHLEAIAHPSAFVCPDCKGGLWQIDGAEPVRYRRHTDHGFTLATLQKALTETMDEALWTAVWSLQDQGVLLAMLSTAHRSRGGIGEAMQLDLVRERIDVQRRQLSTLVRQPPGLTKAA